MAENITWTEQAQQAVARAPGFVQARIRTVAEAAARRNGSGEVTAELLATLMPQSAGKQQQPLPPPAVTDDPLHLAFERKYAIHAGMPDTSEAAEAPAELFGRELADSATSPAKPAVAYIHVPFCSSRCLFCGFYTEPTRPEALQHYCTTVEAEIALAGTMLTDSGRQLQAVYFGGGTPTDLSAADLARLLGAVRRHLPLASDCEITVEGRFHGLDAPKLAAALDAGANRFSFGVQTFNQEIRQRLGRRLGYAQLLERLNQIVTTAAPYQAAVVIDLIYGLPGQGIADVLADIDTAATRTGIHGLDLYQINLIAGTPMMQRRDELPPIAELQMQADMFLAGRNRLIEHGFERLSVAHWRRHHCERSIYNSSIKQGIDCLPLGAGSGGRWGRYQFMQIGDLKLYHEQVTQGRKPVGSAFALSPASAVISAVIGQLDRGFLDLPALNALSPQPLDELLRPELQRWQQAGLIEADNPWRLTAAGEFWNVNLQQLLSNRLQTHGGKHA